MNDPAGAAQAPSPTPTRRTARRIVVAAAAALLACGCRSTVEVATARLPTAVARPHAAGRASLWARACAAWKEGLALERRELDASVDRYYEATVYTAAALTKAAAAGVLDDAEEARLRDAYNAHLGDCLRAAQRFGRLDARASLLVNAPGGPTNVPVRHLGFVWRAEDFGRVVHPRDVPPNPSAHADHDLPGLGAALAVERANPKREPQDEFLPRVAVFNATAVLRPDLDAWLAVPPRPPADVLELYDPARTREVAFGTLGARPLRSDLGVANARAREIQEARGPYALAGFAMPGRMIARSDIRMLEPYQPGKTPLLLIHGLLDDPFLFNDMIIGLQRSPGFLDRHQIWVFRYPTGITFIRSAAILRAQIEKIAPALDPDSADPALSDWTVLGYSMGGLLARLQVSSSGDELWKTVADRPLESLVLSNASRKALRDLFFFEPSPRVHRVIFLATPHDGASPTIALASRLASRIVQRPADTRHLVEEVERNNPGAVRPELRSLPSSVDALAAYSPILPVVRRLPYSPLARLHTIAGTGLHPADGGRGDLVVPLTSAHVDEAESEHHVRATHTTIYYHPDAIDEVRRILGVPRP